MFENINKNNADDQCQRSKKKKCRQKKGIKSIVRVDNMYLVHNPQHTRPADPYVMGFDVLTEYHSIRIKTYPDYLFGCSYIIWLYKIHLLYMFSLNMSLPISLTNQFLNSQYLKILQYLKIIQ